MAIKQKTPVWKGSKDLQEQPRSPQWDYGVNTTCTRTYEASVEVLKRDRPHRGDEMADLGDEGNGVTVRNVRITPLDGGERGRMVVILSDVTGATAAEVLPEPPPQAGEEVVEVDWEPVDKDIRYHPYFENLDKNERALVDKALDVARDPEKEDADLDELVDAMQQVNEDLFVRLLRGQDTYVLHAPVVRKTSWSEAAPTNSNAGKLESPPGGYVPGQWEWFKTRDKAVRRGGEGALWERQEEWSGADEWDSIVYPVDLG